MRGCGPDIEGKQVTVEHNIFTRHEVHDGFVDLSLFI